MPYDCVIVLWSIYSYQKLRSTQAGAFAFLILGVCDALDCPTYSCTLNRAPRCLEVLAMVEQDPARICQTGRARSATRRRAVVFRADRVLHGDA